MKDFKELMKIKQETRVSTPYGDIYSRIYKAIPIGKFALSVQASQYHYCSPRKTLPLGKYDTMEIAIFEKEKWIQPHTDERFKHFSRLNELLQQYEEGEYAVGAYIPIDLIQDLCNYLEKIG